QLGGERRRPVAARPVDGNAVIALRTALQTFQERADELVLGSPLGHEIQGFLGLVGVAVQGNAGSEGASRAGIAPQVRDRRSGHWGLLSALFLGDSANSMARNR